MDTGLAPFKPSLSALSHHSITRDSKHLLHRGALQQGFSSCSILNIHSAKMEGICYLYMSLSCRCFDTTSDTTASHFLHKPSTLAHDGGLIKWAVLTLSLYSYCFNSPIKPYLISTNQTFLQISCQFLTERAIPYLDFSEHVSFSDQNFTQAKRKHPRAPWDCWTYVLTSW